MSTTYSIAELLEHATPDATGRRCASVKVAAGETCTDPASTSRVIHGPVVVNATSYPDGGIDVSVFDVVARELEAGAGGGFGLKSSPLNRL